jgi:F-box interacting protein
MIWWSDFSLGRAASSGSYKVMHLYKTHTMFCDVATITHSGAELTWRQRPPPNLDTSFYSEHKATVKGVLFFLRMNRVAAFDLESELWMKTITGPPLRLMVEQDIALTELKETLCMVHSIECTDNLGGLSLYANVWRLIDYNKSVWVKVYTIRMPAECLFTKVLDVLDDGRILLLNRRRRRYVLQFFNPSMEAFTDIMEMAEGFSGEMTIYTGSLLPT